MHTGDRALNKSLIHQNNRGQVILEQLAVARRVMLAFFADILLALVLLRDLCVDVANYMP
jgi:hypothetical protein